MKTYKAIGYAYDPDCEARDWTKPVEHLAWSRIEAANWCKLNKDWFKWFEIVEIDLGSE